MMITGEGPLPLEIPRDRVGSAELQIARLRQINFETQ
jgi:hypothetical protein